MPAQTMEPYYIVSQVHTALSAAEPGPATGDTKVQKPAAAEGRVLIGPREQAEHHGFEALARPERRQVLDRGLGQDLAEAGGSAPEELDDGSAYHCEPSKVGADGTPPMEANVGEPPTDEAVSQATLHARDLAFAEGLGRARRSAQLSQMCVGLDALGVLRVCVCVTF